MPKQKFKDFPKGFKHFCEDLTPVGIRRVLFLKSEWDDFYKHHGVSVPYLLYRTVYMSFFVVSVSYGINCHKRFFYTYVTYWTIIMQAIYGTLFFFEVLYHYILEKRKKEDYVLMDHLVPSRLTIPEYTIWVLSSIVSVGPLIVTFVYFSVVFPNLDPETMKGIKYCDHVVNVLAHAGNSVFCILELMICALPVHVTHFVFLATYATIYAFFTGFYELSGSPYPFNRTYIYPILDWKNYPGKAVGVSISMILLTVLVHLLLWFIYIGRLFLVSSLLKYDVYSYHEYTYNMKRKTKTATPSLILASNRVAVENSDPPPPVNDNAIQEKDIGDKTNKVGSETKVQGGEKNLVVKNSVSVNF